MLQSNIVERIIDETNEAAVSLITSTAVDLAVLIGAWKANNLLNRTEESTSPQSPFDYFKYTLGYFNPFRFFNTGLNVSAYWFSGKVLKSTIENKLNDTQPNFISTAKETISNLIRPITSSIVHYVEEKLVERGFSRPNEMFERGIEQENYFSAPLEESTGGSLYNNFKYISELPEKLNKSIGETLNIQEHNAVWITLGIGYFTYLGLKGGMNYISQTVHQNVTQMQNVNQAVHIHLNEKDSEKLKKTSLIKA